MVVVPAVTLRPAESRELAMFASIERQLHAREFLIRTTLEQHREAFHDPEITYLAIENSRLKVIGYLILVREGDTGSVEFRRIALDQDAVGVGQEVVRQMECYCRDILQARRIWLDVFEDNARARHVYGKLGYRHFDTTRHEGRKLLLFEKQCAPGVDS